MTIRFPQSKRRPIVMAGAIALMDMGYLPAATLLTCADFHLNLA